METIIQDNQILINQQQLSCNVSNKEIQYGQTAFMQMKVNPIIGQGDILPRLDIPNHAAAQNPPGLEPSVNGLEADISLSKIRVETIHVVYRGLCDLSNLIFQRFKKKHEYITQTGGNYTFKLSYAPTGRPPYINVNFTLLFEQKNIKRDDLGKLKALDKNMLITIGFLENLKSKQNIPGELTSKINEVLNNFIVCSSGKEYLDVGQLYAIIKPNNDANSSILGNFWDQESITNRITQMEDNFQQFLGQLNALYRLEEGLTIPKKPFYETYDSAAATIAGKYYNTYTEATIPVSSLAQINHSTYSNPGSIPFLYDNNQVLYLCFLYNYSQEDNNFDENRPWFVNSHNVYGTNIFNLCKIIKEVKRNLAQIDGPRMYCAVFDLLYTILSNDLNNDIIKKFYKSKDIETYKDYKLINPFEYDLISSAYYFFMEQQKPNNRQNLITANLDSLCHDNQDSSIYRYLMMYNLIKKNNNQTDNLSSNPLLKELLETFPPIPLPVAPAVALLPSQRLPELPDRFEPDMDSEINVALNNLIYNFTDLEKKMFGLLANNGWERTENRLINRMICNNCYVFPVTKTSPYGSMSTNKLFLISMDEALGINCINQRIQRESADVRRVAVASFDTLFPQRHDVRNWYDLFSGTNTQIQVRPIIPYFSRCCCDLAISANLSLTKVDVFNISSHTSIFNITPVTLNDAASAALNPSAIYLPDPVIINFGDTSDPNNYNYNLVFWGYTEDKWYEYKRDMPNLQYFFNLQEFNTDYQQSIAILYELGHPFNLFRNALKDFASASYSTKIELNNRIVCFANNYDTIINRFINDADGVFNIPRHMDCLKPFCIKQNINPEETECIYKTLYNIQGSTFEINLKKTIEKLKSNMDYFREKFRRNQTTANKNEACSKPPVFRNLVDGVMELITYIDEILREQSEISDQHIILECKKIIIGDWLIPFITSIADYFIGAVPHCPEMLGGNGKDDQNKTTNIPITSFIGQYGFYQMPGEDGGLTFKPINTLEEQKQVWEMLGIHVIPTSSAKSIDTGKGVAESSDNLTQIRKEGIIRNLMKTKGLSLEQATAEVNKPYTLPQGKEIVIPPAANIQQSRSKYPELKEGPTTGNDVMSSVGTKRVKTGGKYTRKTIKNKKHKNKTNKKRLIRKKNKRIIRRTRRKH